jgi:aldehyde:ferredoxin oxidoreductase
MGNGYWHKLLRVDLGQRKTQVEEIEEETLRMFIGGAGLGSEILSREVPARTDAYDEKNRLIFGTGPFQGPPIAGSAKFSVVGISPITGTFGDTAAGAGWGPALKDAGYDMLVVEGAADKPVYLEILDSRVEIREASHLWGLDTVQTVDEIRKEGRYKNLSIATIGPAGEKQVAISCIAVDKHSFAGRCGLGAVMGSKKLKAIAVGGTRKVEVDDARGTRDLIKKFQYHILQTVKDNEFRAHGTPSICETAERLGDMPIRYWEGDVWPEGAKRLAAPNSTQVLQAKPLPCKYCPIGCHRKIKVTDPPEYAQEGVGPQYETLGMMGTNLLIDDPKAVARANDLTNRLGMDTISAGAMVGFAIECYEKGLISAKEYGVSALKWGDPRVLFALIEQIGRKESFGSIFSEGTLKAAERIGKGATEIVAHCKGLDLPAHDPRACISLAPTYAAGTRGACHYRGAPGDVEMGGFFIPEIGIQQGVVKFFQRENQGMIAAKCQDYFAILNSLVLCAFMVDGGGMSFSEVQALFNAITGWDYSIDELITAGERIINVQRMINIRDGYGGSTDLLPRKMFRVAQEGFKANKVLPFRELMHDYYSVRGWSEHGEPTPGTLCRLGLSEFLP